MQEVRFRFALYIFQANTCQILSSLSISTCVLWPIAKVHVNLMLTGLKEKIKWLFLSLTCPESHLLTYLFHKTEYGKSSPRKTKFIENRAAASSLGTCWDRNPRESHSPD